MKRKLLTLIVLSMLAAESIAFVKDKPKDKAWIPEETQESIASKQGYQGVRPVVGTVEIDTTPQEGAAPRSDSSNAALLGDSVDEKQVMREGDTRGKSPSRSSFPVWGVVVLVGTTAVLGMRHWLSRNMPPKSFV